MRNFGASTLGDIEESNDVQKRQFTYLKALEGFRIVTHSVGQVGSSLKLLWLHQQFDILPFSFNSSKSKHLHQRVFFAILKVLNPSIENST